MLIPFSDMVAGKSELDPRGINPHHFPVRLSSATVAGAIVEPDFVGNVVPAATGIFWRIPYYHSTVEHVHISNIACCEGRVSV